MSFDAPPPPGSPDACTPGAGTTDSGRSARTPASTPDPTPGTASRERVARPRRFLMAAPRHFDVTYRINPWMHPSAGVDRSLALAQWIAVRDTYRALGHEVDELTPPRGLPDLVFTANAGLVIGTRVLLSRFRHPQRRGEEAVFRDWFRAHGYDVVQSSLPNEGEGDCLVVGDTILAASGFRTNPGAHAQIAERFDRPVVSLVLADPRFYHLDTALAVLDDATIAYFPDAFTARSRDRARRHDVRPQRVLRRSQRRPRRRGRRLRRHVARARVRPAPGRHVGAAEGRRLGEVLHAGAPAVTALASAPDARLLGHRHVAATYHPLPVARQHRWWSPAPPSPPATGLGTRGRAQQNCNATRFAAAERRPLPSDDPEVGRSERDARGRTSPDPPL